MFDRDSWSSPHFSPHTNLCDLEAAKLLSLHVVIFGTRFWRICSLVASGVAVWALEDCKRPHHWAAARF